jgi:16S rRNA U1498 N3-methylase RsmE
MPLAQTEFWKNFPGLVWSNPKADDAVYIRAALLKGRFDVLLPIAVEFGIERIVTEWTILLEENSPETQRAKTVVERILNNIQKGFQIAAAKD